MSASDSDQTASSELKDRLLTFARDCPFFGHMGFEVEEMEPGCARVSVVTVDRGAGFTLAAQRITPGLTVAGITIVTILRFKNTDTITFVSIARINRA